MRRKDHETITVTAFDEKSGKEIMRYIAFKTNGNRVTMTHRDFSAKGNMSGNMISLQGDCEGCSFTFRLYLMDDKYVFQKDPWKNGKVIETQMSYLVHTS